MWLTGWSWHWINLHTIKFKTFHNWWTYNHYVSNIFFFAPASLIVACCFNAPIYIHELLVAEMGFYSTLEVFHREHGGRVVFNSWFFRSNYGFMFKSSRNSKSGGANYVIDITARQALLLIKRQNGEFIHSIQSFFYLGTQSSGNKTEIGSTFRCAPYSYSIIGPYSSSWTNLGLDFCYF